MLAISGKVESAAQSNKSDSLFTTRKTQHLSTQHTRRLKCTFTGRKCCAHYFAGKTKSFSFIAFHNGGKGFIRTKKLDLYNKVLAADVFKSFHFKSLS